MICIGAEVHDDLMNLGWVGKRDGICFELLSDLYGRRYGGPEQLKGFLDQGDQFQRLLVYLGSPAESQDLADQFPGTVRSHHDLIQVFR